MPLEPWHGAPRSASQRRATARPSKTLRTLVSNGACSERNRAQAGPALEGLPAAVPQIPQLMLKITRGGMEPCRRALVLAAGCLLQELQDLRGQQ